VYYPARQEIEMRYIYDARAEVPVINALFIQPTYWCARNCNNCYVKQHIKAGPQVPVHEMVELFWGFYLGTLGECNQITISMDDMPFGGKEGHQWMRNFLEELWEHFNRVTVAFGQRPEVHMTFRSVQSYQEHGKIWPELPAILSMITFSDIIEHDLPWIASLKNRYPRLNVNYNHMSPAYLTNGSWDTHVKSIKQILQVVDSVYLVMEKRPLGEERDLIQVGIDRKRMWHNLNYFKRLQRDLNDRRVSVDGCIQDVVEFERSGNGCSSSISRFQVWPDGSVSGCAYAKQGDTSSAATAVGIIANIRKARETYNFRKCCLPGTYRSLQEKKKT
jgi:hypothetical protein